MLQREKLKKKHHHVGASGSSISGVACRSALYTGRSPWKASANREETAAAMQWFLASKRRACPEAATAIQRTQRRVARVSPGGCTESWTWTRDLDRGTWTLVQALSSAESFARQVRARESLRETCHSFTASSPFICEHTILLQFFHSYVKRASMSDISDDTYLQRLADEVQKTMLAHASGTNALLCNRLAFPLMT